MDPGVRWFCRHPFSVVVRSCCSWWGHQVGKVFAEVKPSIIKSLPIASAEKNQELLIENAVLEIQSKVSESSNLIRNLIKLILLMLDFVVKIIKNYNLQNK